MSVTALSREPDDERRTRILLAAERAFARFGFRGASMQLVAAEARMSAGNLYRYFGSKEDLVSGLAGRDQAALAEDFRELAASADPLAALEPLLRKHLVEAPRACALLALEIWAEAGRNPEVARICRGIETEVRTGLLSVVEKPCAVVGVDPDFAFRVMQTVMAGLFKRRATEAAFDGEAEARPGAGHLLRAVRRWTEAAGRRRSRVMRRPLLKLAGLGLAAAAGIAALDVAVPPARIPIRAALVRVGLGEAADRLAALSSDRPNDRASTPGQARPGETPLADVPRPPAVTVVRAAVRSFEDRLYVSGTLVAREEAMVGPQIDGLRITEVLADDGDRVAKGQVLARLDRTQLDALTGESDAALARADAAIAQAQNAVAQFDATNAQAQADFGRAKQLEAGVISQSAMDQRASAARAASAQLAGARSALAVAEADRKSQLAQRHELDVRIARTEVRAPVAGVVSRRSARIGALAMNAGDALFRIIQNGAIDLDAEVPEGSLARVELGQAVTVTVSGTRAAIDGKVRLISSEVDRTTRLGHIRVALPAASEARVGAFATAVVAIAQRNGIGVPTSALTGESGAWAVETVGDDGRIDTRPVEVGLSSRDDTEIRSGLKAGETVVARAAAFLRAGDLARPIRTAADREASR